MLALGIIGAVVTLAIAVSVLAGALVDRGRIVSAADNAALAAADAARGLVSGVPCDLAAAVAAANRAQVTSCRLDGYVATVGVVGTVVGVPVEAWATAGPPPS